MFRSTLAVAILLAFCPASASAADPGDKSSIEPPDKQLVICKKTRITGSHLKKRICRTQVEIDQEQEDAKRFMRNATRYEDAVRTNESLGR